MRKLLVLVKVYLVASRCLLFAFCCHGMVHIYVMFVGVHVSLTRFVFPMESIKEVFFLLFFLLCIWMIWVFGLCDTSQSPALGVMCTVPDRRAQTLLPIIRRHVQGGSVIPVDAGIVPGRVYVERASWPKCSYCPRQPLP